MTAVRSSARTANACSAGDGARTAALDRLAHEYELRDALDAAWAARPLALSSEGGRTTLLLEDPGGEPLERLIGAPMETGRFLRLAIGIVAALGKAHQRGLVHKDVKPANILANCPDGRTRLTGFGIASRLPRERQAPEPPGVCWHAACQHVLCRAAEPYDADADAAVHSAHECLLKENREPHAHGCALHRLVQFREVAQSPANDPGDGRSSD